MIPKIIHYCWFGKKPLPDSVKKCIDSWKKNCPDYNIIEWNESNYDISKNCFMQEAYDAKSWAFVSDYARLDVIDEYGGIYFDTDVELIRSIDPLLENDGFFGFENDNYVAPGLGFGVYKGHPFIKKLLNIYNEYHFKNENGSFNMIPNPILYTNLLVEMGMKRDNTLQNIDGLTIYPKEYFCPMDVNTGLVHITSNTYSIHWYDSSWCSFVDKCIVKIERYFNKRALTNLGRLFSLPLRIIRKIRNKGFGKTIREIVEKKKK